ncbi:MAG TPA: response regulator transcription factor [Acidimicrobiales bacterium]|jgi:two-component system, OmpR family, response regulator|nr:response regulator transcription factor [Acidimicrobiales bacterium]
MRILVCDDDRIVGALLQRALTKDGHAVDVVESGEEALWLAAEVPFDVIVLDGVLPDLDGFEVCRRLRRDGCSAPVLMLTSRDDVDHRVAGLDSGADDYLVKPFDVKEVLARLRALHRRSTPDRSPVLTVADLELDPAQRRVSRGGRTIELTAKEFELLHLLVRSDGAVVSRQQIVDALWDFATETERNTIDVHVRNLRAKVDRPFDRPLIETVRGAGYKISRTI